MSPRKQAKIRKRRNRRPFVIEYPTIHANGFTSVTAHLHIHPKSKPADVKATLLGLADRTVHVHVTGVWS